MPGIPLVSRGNTYSTSTDLMCRRESHVNLSPEEEIIAEESLSVYCKPVELYNILQRRAATNPTFLQRCLLYKIQAKHKRRIQLSVSLPGTMSGSFSPLHLHVLLARSVSTSSEEHSVMYRFKRLHSWSRLESTNRAQVKFILPEINKLSSEIKTSSLSVLFVSCESDITASFGSNLTKEPPDLVSVSSNVGYCLLGKVSMELLYSTWERSPHLSLGERAEMLTTVSMHSCFSKLNCLNDRKCISFQYQCDSEAESTSQQLAVAISAEEVGAKDKSPYNLYSGKDVPSSSSHIIRLRTGNVIFNYRYYNNKLQRTEVTEDFSCPFCLVKCASFKGLRAHLFTSHDLFNFEFWVTEEYQAVNVSVKTDMWRSEIVANDVDPKQQTFFYCSTPLRCRQPKCLVQNAKHVHPLMLDSDLPAAINELRDKTDCDLDCVDCDACSPNGTGGSSSNAHSSGDPDCVQSGPGINNARTVMLQFAKTRKLSFERSDPRNHALLQKRQFFHSHRAQPMAMEQVLCDRDSEDEVDDVADFEDQRMLDDFVDVTKDEKRMMHLWNSFVRKQHVLADGHVPWACEAFSKLHRQDLVQTPALLWCWRLFMIKLWNHGLLDARTMNSCNIILEQCQSTATSPTHSQKGAG